MEDGVFRRSLRRINPFRSKLFRLPATPRLARSRKVGNGEDVVTEWNFERASTRSANGRIGGTGGQDSTDTYSLPLNQAPPDPSEAEQSIHAHMRTLLTPTPMTSSRREMTSLQEKRDSRLVDMTSLRDSRLVDMTSLRDSRLLQLPSTRYRADGHMTEATWARDRGFDQSPSNSTLSLLNTGGRTRQSEYRPGTAMSRTPSLRPSYPLNGLSRPPSSCDNRLAPINTQAVSSSSRRLRPLFSLTQMTSSSQLEETFIAREWVFREIYQAAIVEKVPLTVLEGCKGAGKTTIFNQLVLNSPFYNKLSSDTLDSGCVSDVPLLPSRNYEWLRAVAGRVVAYHTAQIQSAASCSIPELICNLGAMLAASPVLKSYALILDKRPDLRALLQLDECLRHNSVDVFRKTIAEPLAQLKSTDQGSLVVLLDGVDEAEFHRCEDGRSIGSFLCQILPLLPSWMRVVVSADADGVAALGYDTARTIRIDDSSLDERVVRDNRMLVEYRISMVRELEDTIIALRRLSVQDPLAEFADRVVEKARGNMLYMRLLLQLVETGRLRMTSLSSTVLPDDIHQLYTMYMDLTFTSCSSFSRVSPVLSVLLASLRPLSRQNIREILNEGGQNTRMEGQQLDQILLILSPLLSFSPDDVISLHHPSFRDWLLKGDPIGKYPADARKGHILLALWLSSQSPLDNHHLSELAHHLLKAHPYKYMNGEYAPELTSSKDGQIVWIQKSSRDVAAALLDDRNMHYPNTKVTRLLLVAGADPSYTPTVSLPSTVSSSSTVSPCSDTVPLSVSQLAVAAGHWALVSLLLHYGAGLHPDTGPSLLSMAARFGHDDIIRQLLPLDGGVASVEAAVEAARGGHGKVLSFLLASQWHSLDEKADAVDEALAAAAKEGHTSICQSLVDSSAGADVARAMRAACENGRAGTVQFFLSRGASLASLSWPEDRPALHCAVESGSWDLVVAVLALPSSSLESVDVFGRTALLCAARCGHVGLVDMLLNKGSNPDHRDSSGRSALMLSVREGHSSTTQLLLDREADITGADNEGNTLAHIACRHGSRAILDRLIEAGMLFEEKDKEGDRPIETAIRSRNRAALEALLRRGARLRSTTWQAAVDSDPEALFILLGKLIDDASILFRKKRLEDAMHRLHYALDKCEQFMANDNLAALHPRFLSVKCSVLLSTARVFRREGKGEKAIETCHEAAAIVDGEETLAEILLLRAKCSFDLHDVDRARADARASARLRPGCQETRHLLDTLSQPTTNIARL